MEELPEEIRAVIASHLDEKSRRNMRLASTQWFNRIRYDDFTFKFTTKEQASQIFQRLEKYTNPIGLSFNKSKFSLDNTHYKKIAQLTQLTKLILGGAKRTKMTEEECSLFTNLTNLEILDEILPPKITPHLINLKRITIKSIGAETTADLARFSKLEVVHFHFPACSPDTKLLRTVPHTSHVTFLAMSRVPREIVEETDLTRYSALRQLALSTLLMRDDTDINFPHLPNLEYLLVEATKVGHGLARNSERLTTLGITCGTVESSTLAALTNLRHMTVDFSTAKSISITDLHFFTALTNLEYLKFELAPSSDWTEVLQLIPAEKLLELEINAALKLRHITKFSNLQSLEMYYLLPNPCTATEFETLTNLTSLVYSGVNRELFPGIEKMTKLKQLILMGNTEAPEEDVLQTKFHIENLKALENLQLYESASSELIDSNALQNLPLTRLLIGWGSDDKLIENVHKITTLESLNFRDRNITDHTIQGLSNLTNLTELTIFGTEMTGVNLTLLTSLQMLNVCKAKNMIVFCNELLDALPRLYTCHGW